MPKTAKCPKCGKKIEHLVNVVNTNLVYDLYPTETYIEHEPAFSDGEGDFECPICFETVATTHQDAMKILRG